MTHAVDNNGKAATEARVTLEARFQYPRLFRAGWLLFFAGTPFMGWNSIGVLLLLIHGILEHKALGSLFGVETNGHLPRIRLSRRTVPVSFPIAGLGVTGLVSAVLAVQSGRAVAALLGFILALAFGLVYVAHLQVRYPGWFLSYLWPIVISAIVHAGWAIWKAVETGGRVGVVTFTGRNGVGTLMLLGLILGLVWFASRTDWRRWLSIPYGAWIGAALVMTYSRGSWLGLVAFLVVAVRPALTNRTIRRYAMASLVCAALLFAVVVISVPGAARRAQTFLSLGNETRVSVYESSWHMFTDHLWFGVGPANFDNHWETYNQGRVRQAIGFAHNIFLQVLTETGAIGGLFFGLIVLRLLASVWRNRRTSDLSTWILAAGFLAMLVRDQVDGAILNVNVAFVFWSMAGLTLGSELRQCSSEALALEGTRGAL